MLHSFMYNNNNCIDFASSNINITTTEYVIALLGKEFKACTCIACYIDVLFEFTAWCLIQEEIE